VFMSGRWNGSRPPLDDVIRNVVLQNPHIGDMHFAIFYDYAVQYGSDFNLISAKISKFLPTSVTWRKPTSPTLVI